MGSSTRRILMPSRTAGAGVTDLTSARPGADTRPSGVPAAFDAPAPARGHAPVPTGS